MTVSVFEHPFLQNFLADEEVAALFDVDADLAAMTRFEAALAEAEGKTGVIPAEAAAAIVAKCSDFRPDLGPLNVGTARDGVVVPEFIKALRAHVGEPHSEWVHFGSTSQDVIDSGLILRLKDLIPIFERRLRDLSHALENLKSDQGAVPVIGRTRVQRAVPMTYGDRIDGWAAALDRHVERLSEITPRLLQVQFGGAVGTLSKLGDKGPATRAKLAEIMGLGDPGGNWHSARDNLVEFANWLALVSGTMGKVGIDIALMAQNDVGEIAILAGGGSSAMPHKNNPIDAENLVTLSRFNATQISAMHQSMVHEHERSGMAWTLEWMTLPPMIVAGAKSLSLCKQCLENTKIQPTL